MNIRTKLILMLAVPLIALLLVAFVGFRSQNIDGALADSASESADRIVELDRLWLNIADERVAVLGDTVNAETLEIIAETNALFEELEEGRDAELWDLAEEAQGLLPRIRNATLVNPVGEAASLEVLGQYDAALIALEESIESIPVVGFSADATQVVTGLETARAGTRLDGTAWLHYINLEGRVDQVTGLALVREWNVARELTDLAENIELTDGTRPFEGAARSSAANGLERVQSVIQGRLQTLSITPVDQDTLQQTLNAVPGVDVQTELVEVRQAWDAASIGAEDFLADDLDGAQADIEAARSLTILLGALGGILLVSLLLIIGRSIIGPLNRLMENADVITHERLPAAVAQLRTVGATDDDVQLAPIPKETNDEIGTIVEAFNELQSSALKVATDQAKSRRNVAEMFVSLGRRNQQLNHRMITMITDLERDEQDPETLRGLYELDHLATRMRRNAESLLVLAGNRSPRQWSQPVPFDDVVRSSLAEVEYFERIDIGELPEVQMSGAVVTDITHMLAELLDNATQFSDPTTTVHISARETHTAVEMQITDSGFGISTQDLATYNERVTNPPALDEAPPRLLGLFVVGRLAVQHDVYVQLASDSNDGTTVSISIPKTLFPAEVGENPIDVSRGDAAPIPALGGDTSGASGANDFFGGSDADVAPPVLTDMGEGSTDDGDLPVRTVAAQEDDGDLPVRTVAAQDDDGELPVRSVAAADETDDAVELPIEAATESEESDSWPTATVDPTPDREVSAMEAAQRDADQDTADAENVDGAPIPEMGAPVVAPLTSAPEAADQGDSAFAGLPTRNPQATIETVETGPTVLPLASTEIPDAAPDGDASGSISFGHFAKGVEAGLDDVSSDQGEI